MDVQENSRKWPWDIFFVLALTMVLFNIYHATNRGIWNGSVLDSLTIGKEVLPLAQKTDPRIPSYKPYDGQFYYAIAFDPLLVTKDTVPYIDVPAYRYRRILFPLIAFIAAGGQPLFYPYSLFFVNVICWALIGWGAWKLAVLEKVPSFFTTLGVMTISGLLFSVFRTLTEPLAFCLSLWGIYFYRNQKGASATAFFALAPLARETAIVVPLSILIYEILKSGSVRRQTVYILGLSMLPLLMWWGYLHFRFPGGTDNAHFLSLPFVGIWEEIQLLPQTNTTSTNYARSASLVYLYFFLLLINITTFFKKKSFWTVLALGEAAFCSVVRGNIWDYHASSARVLIPLVAYTLFSLLKEPNKNMSLN